MGVGPELILGNFKNKTFDYTRISIFPLYKFDSGDHNIKINPDSIHSLFVIYGSLTCNESTIEKGTFIKVDDISEINFKVLESAKIFEIISPKEPSYKTYSSMRY